MHTASGPSRPPFSTRLHLPERAVPVRHVMKVLVLHSELGVLRGGGENVTTNLFTAFARRGHGVVAAFVAGRHGHYPFALPDAIEPRPITGWWSSDFGQATLSSIARCIPRQGPLRKQWDRVQQGLQWRAFAWHKRRFQRRIEREFAGRWSDFDAVYVHGDVTMACEVARHRPTVLRLPGPVPEEYGGMLRAVHVVCANGDALVRTRAFLGDHVVELPLGLDTQTFAPGSSDVRSRLGWGDDHRVLGYVGRLTHLKGADILAAAFRDVVRDEPAARMVIIGSGDQERHVRAALARECSAGLVHLEPDVRHDRLAAWYRAMDVMVMPSRYENHSNALVEAMACGVPFVAAAIGGNRKLSETGAGWLFDSGSAVSLSQCLRKAISKPAELKARGQRARSAAVNYQTWAGSAECLETILLSAVTAGHGVGQHSENEIGLPSTCRDIREPSTDAGSI
jgi:glycosyltransferase involved in cell wall biosynthesis